VNVRYTVLGKGMTVTPTVSGTNPVFNHSAIFKFDKVSWFLCSFISIRLTACWFTGRARAAGLV
jgi:hypothetical protein